MVDFCVEPKETCCKNPIGELDFKIDKCYSSIYSRLCRHVNDSVSHISQEERNEWNGKASNSALLDLQDQLNEIAGDGDNSIKKEILIEVSRQISGAIDDLNLGDYAKKKYVDDAISNIDFDQYITKKNADSTYLNKADYIKFDPTNYYTIAQIQKIFGYSKSYFKKHTSNSVAPSKPSANRPPEDGSGWVDDAPNQEAGYYIWMTQVFINGNGQYGEYTNPICLTGTAGENAVSYDIKTSTSTINYQDGAMYPKTISVYVVKSNGSQITNITPSNGSDWQFSYSTNDGTTWNEILFDQIQTGGNYGMLFKATNGTVILNEYVPIVRSGIDGLNGVTYSLQISNISLSYVPVDQNYNLQMSFNVNLYKNENTVNDASVKLYMQLNQNTRTSLQYDSGHWTASINTTVQSKSSTITIYAYNSNGAYLTSMNIPVSASGQKGDKGESVGQTFKGSPLRILGEWQSGKEYYDGKRDAQDGIFYQDVVIYEHTYYVCIDTNAGNDNGWNSTPDVAGYWQNFTVTEDLVTQRIIANQACVKELSSEEVVIMDGDSIVAGMTSSKAIDSKSDLNGKVTNKGDVRIWAGKMQTTGDLTTAYTTIDSNGSIVMQNIQQGKSIKLDPQNCSFKITGPVSVTDDSYTDGTYLPASDERVELANFEYTIDPDTLSSAIRLVMKSNGRITIDPSDKKISVYSGKDGTGGSIIGSDSIDMYDDSGNLYTRLNGIDIAGHDFVTLTSPYNKKGLHLQRINSATSNDILYILDNLPTSDPKMDGVLWMDTDRTLKVSRRGFGS